MRFQLIDQLGKTHFEDSIEEVEGEGTAELAVPNNLTDGIYFLHVVHGHKRVIEKVVIRN